MKKEYSLMAVLLAVCMMVGCDFSEKCRYTGNVQVTVDRKNLVPEDLAGDTLQTVFYNTQEQAQAFRISKDTLLTGVVAGQQQAILFNRPDGVIFRGMDKAETAQAVLPTYTEKGITYTIQAPLLYAGSCKLEVVPFETVLCPFVPESCNQRINFTFTIICEPDAGEPVSLNGSLSGTATVFSLSRLKPVRSDGTVKFGASKETENSFTQSLNVLGVNPVIPGQTPVPKILQTDILLADGYIHHARMDMTTLFDMFTERVLDCKVEIVISSLGTKIEITDWKQYQQGNIEIH